MRKPILGRQRGALIALVGSVGCGSIAGGGSPDAASSDAAFDAPADGQGGLGAWGAPVEIAELSGGNPQGPSLTHDQLEIYFHATRAEGMGLQDVYVARRASVNDSWSAPEPVTPLNSASIDAHPSVAPDGLTLWFDSNRNAKQELDIHVSVRASRSAPWGAPVPVTELNTVAVESAASTTADGLMMVFHSTRGGGSDRDLFLSTRAAAGGTWATPVPLAEVNSAAEDRDGHLSEDGLVLYLISSRIGAQSRDLYRASRASRGAAFGAPERIVELSTAREEVGPWVSPDERVIYFSRAAEDGTFALYQATR